MRATTDVGAWLVPPQRAVWIPPGVIHEVTSIGPTAMRSVYIHERAAPSQPATCCVITVTGLLREIVTAAVDLPESYARDGPEARLGQVLIDEIARAPRAELHLPIPQDRRLLAVTDAIIAEPGTQYTLTDFARSAGASVRTLARLFVAETGLSFRAWRQQARLHAALALLAAGEPVTQVAYRVGYESPSAFIAMFREAMGETPRRHLGRGRTPSQ